MTESFETIAKRYVAYPKEDTTTCSRLGQWIWQRLVLWAPDRRANWGVHPSVLFEMHLEKFGSKRIKPPLLSSLAILAQYVVRNIIESSKTMFFLKWSRYVGCWLPDLEKYFSGVSRMGFAVLSLLEFFRFNRAYHLFIQGTHYFGGLWETATEKNVKDP